MKFAIISDTHDNEQNFIKAITWLNARGVREILHCGDICNREIMEAAQKQFDGRIRWVRGNGDFELRDVPEILDLVIDTKKVACVHYPELARRMAESGNYDLVFYGHTHRPWLARIATPARQPDGSLGGGRSVASGEEKVCLLVNPGELAGQRYKSTFALYDTVTDKLELKILEQLDS